MRTVSMSHNSPENSTPGLKGICKAMYVRVYIHVHDKVCLYFHIYNMYFHKLTIKLSRYGIPPLSLQTFP